MNSSVIHSIEDEEGLRCVDLGRTDDDRFWFKVFRRDPEDGGRWTLTADYSGTLYPTEADAISAASSQLPWFAAHVRVRHTASTGPCTDTCTDTRTDT